MDAAVAEATLVYSGTLKVGDVIRWPGFANAYLDHQNKYLLIGERIPVESGSQRLYDDSRGSAEFVVIEVWQDSHDKSKRIIARRLYDNGKYNQDGEMIYFWSWNRNPSFYEVIKVREMQQVFI